MKKAKAFLPEIITAVPKRSQGNWSRSTVCCLWKGKEAREPRWERRNTVTINFDAALKKAMRSYNYKDKVSAVLEQSDTYRSLNKPLQEIKLANEEWRVLLGDESYDNLFALLEKGGFFNPLFKG